jgi:periplasmic divalent cation tolerance protein
MVEAQLVYMTCSSQAEAATIGRALVDERLAACVNLIGGMRSIYRWQGAVEQADEVVLIAKTVPAMVERLTARVRQLHSYSCPCIVVLPILGGNPEFLGWIRESVDSGEGVRGKKRRAVPWERRAPARLEKNATLERGAPRERQKARGAKKNGP